MLAEQKAGYWLLAIDLTLIAAFLGLFLSDIRVGFMAIGHEQTIPNWYSAAKLMVLAQLLAFLAWRTPTCGWRELLALAAPVLLFLFLSVEEVAALQDRIMSRLLPLLGGKAETAAVVALLLGVPLAVVIALVGHRFARIARPGVATAAKGAAGAVLFLLGAVGLDALLLPPADAPGARILPAALEEGCELIGVSLMIWATLDLVMPHVRRAWPAPAMNPRATR